MTIYLDAVTVPVSVTVCGHNDALVLALGVDVNLGAVNGGQGCQGDSVVASSVPAE